MQVPKVELSWSFTCYCFGYLQTVKELQGFLYFFVSESEDLDSFSVFFLFHASMGLVSEAFVAEYWVKAFFFFFEVEFAVEADFDFLEGLFVVYTFTLQEMSKFVGWTKLEKMFSETEMSIGLATALRATARLLSLSKSCSRENLTQHWVFLYARSYYVYLYISDK